MPKELGNFCAKKLKVPFRDSEHKKIFGPQLWDDTVNMHIEWTIVNDD